MRKASQWEMWGFGWTIWWLVERMVGWGEGRHDSWCDLGFRPKLERMWNSHFQSTGEEHGCRDLYLSLTWACSELPLAGKISLSLPPFPSTDTSGPLLTSLPASLRWLPQLPCCLPGNSSPCAVSFSGWQVEEGDFCQCLSDYLAHALQGRLIYLWLLKVPIFLAGTQLLTGSLYWSTSQFI